MRDASLHLGAALLAPSPLPDEHEYVFIVRGAELLGLEPEVIELFERVGDDGQEALWPVVDGRIGHLCEVVDFDLRIEEAHDAGRIPRREGLIAPAGKLHVLLRHRAPSISE